MPPFGVCGGDRPGTLGCVTERHPSLPGNPTPGELAVADQKVARVAAAVDGLLAGPRPPRTGDHAADVINLAAGPIVEATITLSDLGREQLMLLAAELLFRLTSPGPPQP